MWLEREGIHGNEPEIDILGGSPEKFGEALDYPAELLDAFDNCLKGEGVDVEELDFVDKKDKAARQS